MLLNGIKTSTFNDMTWKSGFSNFSSLRAPRYLINPFQTVERIGLFCWFFR